ncbi:hypothetical protein [Deinococcus sp. YIM 77859]|uniref:hypothetical protein n=1 Tax=Deinococcus sp. YIM 77859 TaxID=1540221 RepID=UPI0012E03215|nr:hypothetical protein [Deinococcus sp. YIM 77859]
MSALPRHPPTASTLDSARNLRDRYMASDERRAGYVIVLGECAGDRQTYYVCTRREAPPSQPKPRGRGRALRPADDPSV